MKVARHMPRAKKKVVQTELEPGEYETLLSLAKSKNMTVKEAAREALQLWSVSVSDLSQNPLFKLKPVKFKVKVKSDEIEEFLYKTGLQAV
jgi:hypothetical protein